MWNLLLYLAVCGAAFCKDVKADAKITVYSLTQNNHEFNPKQIGFSAKSDGSAVAATINPNVKHQTILGFGGSFSDATGINLNKASADVRAKILKALFSKDGIAFNLCRVPIGSTEFSDRPYTLDDHEDDVKLEKFALQQEDNVNKVCNYEILVWFNIISIIIILQ